MSSRKKEHHLYVIVNTYNKPLQKRHVKSLSESNRVARAQRKKKTEERKTDDISLSFSFVRKNNGLMALLFPRTDTTKSLSLFGGNNCVEGITRKKIIEKEERKRRKKKKEGVFEIQTLNTQRWSLGFVSCCDVFLLCARLNDESASRTTRKRAKKVVERERERGRFFYFCFNIEDHSSTKKKTQRREEQEEEEDVL